MPHMHLFSKFHAHRGGVLNSLVSIIFFCMDLVDLLSLKFMKPSVYNSIKLQIDIVLSVLTGFELMSMLPKWA
jgi:hypothetical protein